MIFPESITSVSNFFSRNVQKTKLTLLLSASATLLMACDGSELLIHQPDISINVPALLKTAAAHHSESSDNLLTNPGFEDQLNGWDACNTSSALRTVGNRSQGQFAVAVKKGNCIQQGVEIDPGNNLTLSCDIRTTGNNRQWSGLGMSFYDINGHFISEPEATQIDKQQSYKSFNVSGTAPTGTYFVGLWFYTDKNAMIDNCSLTTEQPPISDGNLLVNGSFDILDGSNGPEGTGIAYWFNDSFNIEESNIGPVQSPISEYALSIDFEENFAQVKQFLTADALQTLRGGEYQLTCDGRNNHPIQAAFLSVTFLDENATPNPSSVGASTSILPATTQFQSYQVTGNVPDSDGLSGEVKILTGNRNGQNSTVELDNCVLTAI